MTAWKTQQFKIIAASANFEYQKCLVFALKLDKYNCNDNKLIALCKSSGGNSELLRFSGSRQSVFEVCLVCSRSMLPSSLHSIARHCRLTHRENPLKFCSKKLCVCQRLRFRALIYMDIKESIYTYAPLYLRLIHERTLGISEAHPGQNAQLSCRYSFKTFSSIQLNSN